MHDDLNKSSLYAEKAVESNKKQKMANEAKKQTAALKVDPYVGLEEWVSVRSGEEDDQGPHSKSQRVKKRGKRMAKEKAEVNEKGKLSGDTGQPSGAAEDPSAKDGGADTVSIDQEDHGPRRASVQDLEAKGEKKEDKGKKKEKPESRNLDS